VGGDDTARSAVYARWDKTLPLKGNLSCAPRTSTYGKNAFWCILIGWALCFEALYCSIHFFAVILPKSPIRRLDENRAL
jgi:hypothetical protein